MPPRILGLHGLYQSGARFADKLQHLPAFKAAGASAEFLDAPHQAIPKVLRGAVERPRHSSSKVPKPHELRAWWTPERGSDEELEETIRALRDCAPADVVVGFSQGAALAGLMLTNEMADRVGWRPEAVVLFSGYRSPLEVQEGLWASGVDPCPAVLHIYGKEDSVVPPTRSRQLAELLGGEAFEHPQGHLIPTFTESVAHADKMIGEALSRV